MNRTPVIIALLLLIVASIAILLIATTPIVRLSDSERIQNAIAVIASTGALISATFVVYSYVQTNRAFVDSQRPQLLVQIVNETRQGAPSPGPIPVTVIHYRNITINRFTDLTITLKVYAGTVEIDLSDLFKPNMVMVGLDQRQRRFEPVALLSGRGIALNDIASKGDKVILKPQYSYTYNGIREIVNIQEYEWDSKSQTWDIV